MEYIIYQLMDVSTYYNVLFINYNKNMFNTIHNFNKKMTDILSKRSIDEIINDNMSINKKTFKNTLINSYKRVLNNKELCYFFNLNDENINELKDVSNLALMQINDNDFWKKIFTINYFIIPDLLEKLLIKFKELKLIKLKKYKKSLTYDEFIDKRKIKLRKIHHDIQSFAEIKELKDEYINTLNIIKDVNKLYIKQINLLVDNFNFNELLNMKIDNLQKLPTSNKTIHHFSQELNELLEDKNIKLMNKINNKFNYKNSTYSEECYHLITAGYNNLFKPVITKNSELKQIKNSINKIVNNKLLLKENVNKQLDKINNYLKAAKYIFNNNLSILLLKFINNHDKSIQNNIENKLSNLKEKILRKEDETN